MVLDVDMLDYSLVEIPAVEVEIPVVVVDNLGKAPVRKTAVDSDLKEVI